MIAARFSSLDPVAMPKNAIDIHSKDNNLKRSRTATNGRVNGRTNGRTNVRTDGRKQWKCRIHNNSSNT